MPDPAWNDTLVYLRLLDAAEYEIATDLLANAMDRDGEGAVADALIDCCRALMEHVVYKAGIVDVRGAVHNVATRIADITANTRLETVEELRTLLVFLGSEGLPCAARTAVMNWRPQQRLCNLVSCTVGLAEMVAHDEGRSVADLVAQIDRPGPPQPAEGTFGLAWRAENSATETAHIAFVAEMPSSLRAILARVALLRDGGADVELVDDPAEYRGLGEHLGSGALNDVH